MYADDMCIVSRPPRGLERIMAIFVEIFGAFGLTIPEGKTETIRMPISLAHATQLVFNATGPQCRQTTPSSIWEASSLTLQTCRPRLTTGSVRGGWHQALHAEAVRPPEGKCAASGGPNCEIRRSRGFPIGMRDVDSS